MKLKDLSNLTLNKANSQYSFNLKALKLRKIGITPEQLLNLKISNSFIKKVKKGVKIRNGNNKSSSSN